MVGDAAGHPLSALAVEPGNKYTLHDDSAVRDLDLDRRLKGEVLVAIADSILRRFIFMAASCN